MKIAIYGCGGLGRETAELAKIVNGFSFTWDDILFVDDRQDIGYVNGLRVISFEKLINEFDKDDIQVIISVGEPKSRELMYKKVISNGFSLGTLIHPSVHIPKTSEIGMGAVINQGCYVSCNVTIGNNVFLQQNVIIGHDTIIGDNSLMSAHSFVGGNSVISNNVYIGPGVSIKESINIGRSTVIGMGSIVLKDVSSFVIALGNPARVFAKNDDEKVF